MDKQSLPDARQRCPYYGFSHTEGNLFYSNSNQCALKVKQHVSLDSFSPCEMEDKGLKVNWDSCPLRNTNLLDKINSRILVFPKGWDKKVKLEEWEAHVMSSVA